jgi:hypothetical protein
VWHGMGSESLLQMRTGVRFFMASGEALHAPADSCLLSQVRQLWIFVLPLPH